MAKSKQSGSVAARREQERQQRQRRESLQGSERSGRGPKASYKRRKDRSQLYMIVGVIALFVVIIAAFVFISHLPASQTNTNPLLKEKGASQAVLQQLTGVSQQTWEAINTGGGTVTNPPQAQKGQVLLKGPDGHPEFFYVGGEYCPYCAAERWAIINALSRFGTFSNLSQIQSYENNISTFSFYGSSYSSPYVDFVPVEVNGNQLDSTGQAYVPLQKLTSDQQKIFTQYNSAQSFPFYDIGNQYTGIGASYSPTLLLNGSSQPLSWDSIANALKDPKSPIAQGILGTANYMTAAICNVTNQQPGSVCNSAVIQKIEQSLGKSSNFPGRGSLALAPSSAVADQRRLLI